MSVNEYRAPFPLTDVEQTVLLEDIRSNTKVRKEITDVRLTRRWITKDSVHRLKHFRRVIASPQLSYNQFQ